jgi:hypothetical protein
MRPPRQIGWVISVEDWALIRRLVADGVPRRQVAPQLGIGRSTVDRALESDRPPKYERKPGPTSFTPFEARVRAILAEHPEMPATHQNSEPGRLSTPARGLIFGRRIGLRFRRRRQHAPDKNALRDGTLLDELI